MAEFLVVYKPSSGRQAQKHLQWLKRQEQKHQITWLWYGTTGEFETDCQTIRLLANTVTQVIVIGGDGTLHLVVNATVDMPCRLALLPAGTGNDFARQFPFSEAQWRDTVFSDKTQRMDLGKVGGCYFHNIGGVGFNAAVVEALSVKNKRHPLSYVTAGLSQLFCFAGVSLELDGRNAVPTMMLVVANGRYFAAGLRPAPNNDNQDGQFELLLFKGCKGWQRVASFVGMLLQFHTSLPFVESWNSESITVRTVGLPIEADGELVGMTPATFECLPEKLQLAVL
ncbi:diacylglycerol/lipid kinase family protein [Pseudoalteromonas xiamenensis]|uniref:YegS/Rv2252/BmrU family lipid kinase n=1 Tax=Pseudoalteromonas xiamenensis TaxID=882626 RepID=A0A975DEB7_9GAMM|nr:YegS/Rv2252/BmrU family lipid kinase [Pseudoalteromonas xiamenensis]QTH70261.1 YegS/Rv2252/BmrU family lipid kinase [Pseudoalteromonas xiamenensis]